MLTRAAARIAAATIGGLFLASWAAAQPPLLSPTSSSSQPPPAKPATAPAKPATVPAGESLSHAAERAIAHGKPAEAEALARAKGATDPEAAAVLARLAIARGRYEEAASLLQAPATANPTSEAALELGLLLRQRGRKDEARRALAGVAAAAGSARTADALLRCARASWALAQFRTANSLFRDALAAAPGDPAVNTAWGEAFLEKRQDDAVPSFRAAVARDAQWAPAHLGLARALEREGGDAVLASARRAIEIDDSLVGARLLLAEQAMGADRWRDAEAEIGRALAVNPRSPDAHALAGALAYVEGKTPQFEAAVAKALEVNPVFADAYLVPAAAAAENSRFDEAVALARRGVALDSGNARAHADLGLHLFRAGDEREARVELERGFDGFDRVTDNLLKLLDTLDTFVSVPAGDAIVRLHPAEAPVLRHYAVPIVEEAMAAFTKRYGFAPRGPVLVEIFANHDDFAVRTLGVPGLLGALGACFGRVVTLNSPHARDPGTFNWQATLWHELAHVFTLQLSNQRVPRWLTEGVSVYEEGRVRPEWARDSELTFARAYAEGRIPTLANLNGAFTHAGTVTLAYFQSSVLVGLIVDRWGDAGLVALLKAYGEGLETEAALRKATGSGLAALQAAFDERIAERYARIGRALRVPEGVAMPAAGDVAAFQALAARWRESYPVQMAAGNASAAAGLREAAFAAFERASALVPGAVGADSPHARIADLAERSGDRARAIRELRALLAGDHTNVSAARKLAELAAKAGDADALRFAVERVATVDPFDAPAHTTLGRFAMERRDLPVALRGFRVALAAGPTDLASSHCDLAEALLASGNRAGAKREVLAALEIAPTYPRAQDLLLKIIEGSGNHGGLPLR